MPWTARRAQLMAWCCRQASGCCAMACARSDEKLRPFIAACWQRIGKSVSRSLEGHDGLTFGSLCSGLEVGGMALEAIKECMDPVLGAGLRLTVAAEIAPQKRRVLSAPQSAR
jgi:hypothetical protein